MLWELRWSRVMLTEVHPADWLTLNCERALLFRGALGGLGAGWAAGRRSCHLVGSVCHPLPGRVESCALVGLVI